jgi:hypothetical protein
VASEAQPPDGEFLSCTHPGRGARADLVLPPRRGGEFSRNATGGCAALATGYPLSRLRRARQIHTLSEMKDHLEMNDRRKMILRFAQNDRVCELSRVSLTRTLASGSGARA